MGPSHNTEIPRKKYAFNTTYLNTLVVSIYQFPPTLSLADNLASYSFLAASLTNWARYSTSNFLACFAYSLYSFLSSVSWLFRINLFALVGDNANIPILKIDYLFFKVLASDL